MSRVTGNISKLSQLAASLRQLPRVLAIDVAAKVAPSITALARASFDGGRTAYGDARPAGVHGNALTLVKSGDTAATLNFVAIGTKVRAVLGTRYAKFLIGKYGILPSGALPFAWADDIDATARAEIAKALGS